MSGGLVPGPTNGEYRSVQVFTATGTWTKPAGLKRVRVTVVGSGGSGGSSLATAAGQSSSGGGGGGAGAAIKTVEAAALGATEAVTVGVAAAAPTAANNGNNGNSSSFGAHCVAGPGGGGTGGGATAQTGVGGNGGAAGTGTTGDILISGSEGESGLCFVSAVFSARPGSGGESYMSARAFANGSFTVANAVAGKNYGGGSSGTALGASQAAVAGAASAPGIVIVEEFF